MPVDGEQRDQTNFFRLVVAQFVFRVGWIFKTESIVMPAALDMLAGAGWVRGLLPLLSRLGLSLTPVIFGHLIRNRSHKKRALAVCVGCMAISMGMMSVVWWTGLAGHPIAVPIYLALYGLFFAFHGLNQVAFGLLQAKVIPIKLRGRLMMAGNLGSSAIGVALVLLLLPGWLAETTPRFDLIFLMPAVWFGLSALCTIRVQEQPDRPDDRWTSHEFMASTMRLVRTDRSLRASLWVAILAGFSLVLFPHYQAIARQSLGLPVSSLTGWIVGQSIGAAIASVVGGWLADRYGNRFVLSIVVAGLAATPLWAITLAQFPRVGAALFPTVFMCIGITPVMFRIFQNYVIEVVAPGDRAQALSCVTLCLAAPVLSSPVFGALIDIWGFPAVFCAVAAAVSVAWLLTFRLVEPRFLNVEPAPTPEEVG